MNATNLNPEDAKLRALLSESHPTPSLPPRFQENVWRRIERAEVPRTATARAGWLDAVATWILRPQLAFVVAAILVLLGVGLGWNNGQQLAQADAQNRYLEAVAPSALH